MIHASGGSGDSTTPIRTGPIADCTGSLHKKEGWEEMDTIRT